MAFAKISQVKDWEDFGFKFKEGTNETAWDDKNSITTFHYTEPMTWWMPMPPEMPRTMEAALAEAKRLADEGNARAKAFFTSSFRNGDRGYEARFMDTSWCNGVVWSMNSMPGITAEFNDFNVKWNKTIVDSIYGLKAKGRVDGEYTDSCEGWVTSSLNYRREHFAASRTALTFHGNSFEPAIFKGNIMFEYLKGVTTDVHKMDKLTMGNSTPTNFCWLAPMLDVMGTETNWIWPGHYAPMTHADMIFRRVMCKGKPYCFIMNTDFSAFTHDLVEKYMNRCLAYGMYPGFFNNTSNGPNHSAGHYFSTPKFYNRDRDLFKKYMPLCKLVGQAGWEPITRATCTDSKIMIERFGEQYLTVYNNSPQSRNVTITLEGRVPVSVKELVSDQDIKPNGNEIQFMIDGEKTAVFEISQIHSAFK
jgi:hypothetical protein